MISTAKLLESRVRWLKHGSSASGLWAALAALLMPKCPLCIAALLTFVGMNAALASAVAPLIRPLAFGLPVAIVLSLFAMRYLMRAPRVHTPDALDVPDMPALESASHRCCK